MLAGFANIPNRGVEMIKKCPNCKGTGRVGVSDWSMGSGRVDAPQKTEPCNYRKCGGNGSYAFDPIEEAKLDREEAESDARHSRATAERMKETVAYFKEHGPSIRAKQKSESDELWRRLAAGPKQKFSPKSSRLGIVNQLAVLAKLRKEGSLTEQEFQTLKTRLISGGKS